MYKQFKVALELVASSATRWERSPRRPRKIDERIRRALDGSSLHTTTSTDLHLTLPAKMTMDLHKQEAVDIDQATTAIQCVIAQFY